MDILTQGLLGAAVAQSGSKQNETKIATLIGFLAGLLADADVLIQSAKDTLYTIEYHRHFTHSLIFIPVGALIAAVLLWPFMKKRLAFPRLYLYCLLGYLLSGTLDAFTSFGTYLYWPFSNERVAWHLVSIVDPVITLLLLVAILVGLKLGKTITARTGLILCTFYLILNAIQLNRVENYIHNMAEQRGHTIERMVAKPTLGNNLVWRSTYIYQEKIYIDAIRAGLSDMKQYQGGVADLLTQAEIDNQFSADSVLYNDIKRFKYFSDDYITWHPDKANVIGDVRYALLPDSNKPLWGIEFDTKQANSHARFVTFRTNNEQNRSRFFDMVKGLDVSPTQY